MDERSDDDLLAATRTEPEAFAVFYRRHVEALLAYFARRTRNAELAADLTAETFAAALDGAHRHRPDKGPAVAWLYGIARRQLAHAARKGAVEDRARRRLGMARLQLTDEALERVEALATADASARTDPRRARGTARRPARGRAGAGARGAGLRGDRQPAPARRSPSSASASRAASPACAHDWRAHDRFRRRPRGRAAQGGPAPRPAPPPARAARSRCARRSSSPPRSPRSSSSSAAARRSPSVR